jgi:hypothetical protein
VFDAQGQVISWDLCKLCDSPSLLLGQHSQKLTLDPDLAKNEKAVPVDSLAMRLIVGQQNRCSLDMWSRSNRERKGDET